MSTRAAAPSPVVRPKPALKRRRSRVTTRAVILFVLVLTVLMFAIAPFRAYLQQRAEIRDLQRQATVLQQANLKLDGQVARLHDPGYLEQLARECLGLVRPGETGFVVVPKGGGTPPSDC